MYADGIRALRELDPIDEQLRFLLLKDSGKLRIYYGPFDWVNSQASVVIVGITPGEHTMRAALITAAECLRNGDSVEEALKRAKRSGSFSNMRGTIGKLLDKLGLQSVLNLRNSELLFDDWNFLHATSCIRYPTFTLKKGEWSNYSGHSPKLWKSDLLVQYLEEVLAPELRHFPRALIVPCGEGVTRALCHLREKQMFENPYCLFGFPHASGSNNGLIKEYLCQSQEEYKTIVQNWGRQL